MQNRDMMTDGGEPIRDAAVAEALPAGGPAKLGLHLMSRNDLAAAVGDCEPGRDGDWEDGGAPSREEAVRLKTLARYRDDPGLTWRPHLVADDAMLARLGRLAAEAGNMLQAIEAVRRAAVISRHTGTPLRVPPLVLVGPPGTGKTRITGTIAAALGTSSRTVMGTALHDTGPITGLAPHWRAAGPGIVAKALLACATAAPVVVVDECEKISLSAEDQEHPLDCILQLLEPTTAGSFRDNYLDVPMRAENVLWMFCANGLDGLSRPLLDRCIVIDVPELSGDARRRALEELVADTVLEHGVAPADLDDESLAVLDGIGLRRARAVVTAALAGALEAGRGWPTAADFRIAAALLAGEAPPPRKRQVGFVHF